MPTSSVCVRAARGSFAAALSLALLSALTPSPSLAATAAAAAAAQSVEPAAEIPYGIAFPTPVTGEVFWRPADGVFDLLGHGWGHGLGMSQYGAQGAAKQGLTVEQILAHYYPGTVLSEDPANVMRVWISRVGNGPVELPAVAGLTVHTRNSSGAITSSTLLPANSDIRAWRVLRSGDTSVLELRKADGSYAFADSVNTPGLPTMPTADTLVFTAAEPVAVLFPNGQVAGFRGEVAIRRNSFGTHTAVNTLPLQEYLYSVVPSEMPRSWLPAALQSQAVAARTYSVSRKMWAPSSALYDICDTVNCQEYHGAYVQTGSATVSYEWPSTTEAVNATAGKVLKHDGKYVDARYSASNGGHTVAHPTLPYLPAKPDPYDRLNPSSVHAWAAKIPVVKIEQRWPELGTFHRMQVMQRDGGGVWNGRTQNVRLEGVKDGQYTVVNTTGNEVYKAHAWPANPDGPKGRWWAIFPVGQPPVPVDPNAPTEPAPAPPAPEAGKPTLTVGARGPEVVQVQRAVGTGADGIFGRLTADAVRRYQASRGIPVTGVVDGVTWNRILTNAAPVVATPPPPPPAAAPAPAPAPVARPTLRLGARGEAVKVVQRHLRISADGVFGTGTAAAVKRFQSAHRLVADGVVGPGTWSKIP